ncbi:MAG: glycine dehydrogenase (aminomethyl-transferring), partial [Flammeovirgaceae bacterium]|nr:glycine dehydrogenase (aminomethyl-transferring) [Flammeovirgaceae bacterium]MDW8287604.1 glycine dehydrogenase (aminomethyl-transferring) [Flammeovirgaceae bacterium]
MKIPLNNFETFEARHNSSSPEEIREMLKLVKAASLDELIGQTIPEKIRLKKELQLPKPQTEHQFLRNFKKIAAKNKIFKSYIGQGYYDCITPTVILRNILENPGWYTAYTPYQAEIAQGRLEMLLNFQTMVKDLTGMELANASLLDEGTAAAEAMTLLFAAKERNKKNAYKFFVSHTCHPQTIDVLKTRSKPLGIELVIGDYRQLNILDPYLYGVLLQYPDTEGEVVDYTDFIAACREQNVKVAIATDLLALTLLKPPGEMGADVAVGSAQRFGVPMGYGGPHAAFFATKDEYKRLMPGRIIGVSRDADGNIAYRMALQTREQHIRREKATSNICTAQVLLAVVAAAYAIYHGAEGLKNIALRVHGLTKLLAESLKKYGVTVHNRHFFDTLKISFINVAKRSKVRSLAADRQMNFRIYDDYSLGISLDETTTLEDVKL